MSFRKRVASLVTIDFILLFGAFLGAFLPKFSGSIPPQYVESMKLLVFPVTIVDLIFLYFLGFYRKLWQYASIGELLSILQAITYATLVVGIINEFASLAPVPFTIYIIAWSFKIICIGGSRFAWRVYRDRILKQQPYHKKALIVGAGMAGGIVVREILKSNESDIYPVGFVDDDEKKQHLEAFGFPVLGKTGDIPSLVITYNVLEIIIAIPSAKKDEFQRILEICKQTGVSLKILPGVRDLITGKVKMQKLRKVEVEDLLGREPIKIDLKEIAGYLEKQTILVTGAGGSIGSELCRQVANFNPEKIILLGHGENSIYDIELELKDKFSNIAIQTEVCDIKDRNKVNYIFEQNKPDVVFHAAAHKHVPLMERNPDEAVKNNVLGTKNVAEASDRAGVKTFVLISTDKAVNPTSVMGATKRLAEMVIQSLNQVSETNFVAVRFGNVLGSRGSVIPLFKKQIAKGGPVTVTHPEMIRYFMTIPEAVQLVIQAGSMAQGGEIFILDMGKQVKIADLARDLIRLSGLEPDKDIEIKYTGIRPGEKLYEEILTAEEGTNSTQHAKIFVAKPNGIDETLLVEFINGMSSGNLGQSHLEIIDYMLRLIPTFKPQNERFRSKEVV